MQYFCKPYSTIKSIQSAFLQTKYFVLMTQTNAKRRYITCKSVKAMLNILEKVSKLFTLRQQKMAFNKKSLGLRRLRFCKNLGKMSN